MTMSSSGHVTFVKLLSINLEDASSWIVSYSAKSFLLLNQDTLIFSLSLTLNYDLNYDFNQMWKDVKYLGQDQIGNRGKVRIKQ